MQHPSPSSSPRPRRMNAYSHPVDLQQGTDVLPHLQHDLDDAVYANDENSLRLRCGIPGQPNLLTLTSDIEGSNPGHIIPMETIIQATKKALTTLKTASLWTDNSVVDVKIELLLVNIDSEQRQASCLFGRHNVKETGPCTSRCLTCGDVFCHCTNQHCCCPEHEIVELRDTTILTIGRLRLKTNTEERQDHPLLLKA